MAYKITNIEGDLTVGHNETIGGTLNVNGKATFKGGAYIKGFLECEFIKDWNKGFFDNPSDLFAAYPNPQPGWVAFVQVDGKYFLYRENKGSWSFTSTDVSQFIQIVGDINNYTQEVGELREEVAENQGSLSSFISQITEVKDTANKASKDVGDLGNKVSDIESSVSEQNGKIQTLENASIQAGNNLTALTKTVSDIKASNGAHEVKISDLESKIKIRYAESITGLKTITNNGKTLQVPVENGTIATTRITDGISQSLSDVEFNLNELDRHVEEQLEAINADQSNLHDLHDQEVADRKSAITSLSSEFNQSLLSEAQERMAADSSLGNRITTLSNTVDINKITTDSLIDVVNDRVTNIATPRVAIIEAGTKTIQQNSVVRNYDVVFLSTMKCFAAKTSDGYFNNWMKYSVYPSANVYGAQENEVNNGAPSPIVGRLYTKDNELYIWDGNNFIVQGKVNEKIINAIAEIIANAPEDFDTLKEVAEYIASDKTNADKIITDISNLKVKDSTHDTEIATLKQKNTQLTNSINVNATNIAKNTSDITANTEVLAKQAKELTNKAPKVGYAPDLKVDFAKELVGRGVAEPQEIGTIRPTGVISIGDGNATIEKLKGKSVVLNQLCDFEKITGRIGLNVAEASRNAVTLSPDINAIPYRRVVYSLPYDVVGRTLFIRYSVKCSRNVDKLIGGVGVSESETAINGAYNQFNDVSTDWVVREGIYTYSRTIGNTFCVYFNLEQSGITEYEDFSLWLKDVVIHDLTKMFGAGNEPTTIEEFEARRPLGVTDDYNEGEIISYDGENELKSVGLNMWNGKNYYDSNEYGKLYSITLYNENLLNQVKKMYLLWKEGYDLYYSCKVTGTVQGVPIGCLGLMCDNKLLPLVTPNRTMFATNLANVSHDEIANADIVRLYATSLSEWSISDICVHLAHTGYRNGEYVPYEDDILQLPNIKAIKDKDGNQLFPYGLLSAGSAHDEITSTKAIKRIGVVDMGTMSWALRTDTSSAVLQTHSLRKLILEDERNNLLCDRYAIGGSTVAGAGITASSPEKTLYKHYLSGGIHNYLITLRDSAYTSADEFKQAMQGVMLYYELAEPIEVDLPEPLNLTYDAWDFGTEELIAEGATTPLNADIVYQFNAVDRIRENSNKQDQLVSGENIKTINGVSILGSGNIEINSRTEDYALVLNKTFSEDVATYNVADDVPNITSFKNFVIYFEFKYQEGKTRGGWDFIHLGEGSFPRVVIENGIVKDSFGTHYIMRLHLGDKAHLKAYIESRNNSFLNPQKNDGLQGLNLISNDIGSTIAGYTAFVFGSGFISGEKIRIYAK